LLFYMAGTESCAWYVSFKKNEDWT